MPFDQHLLADKLSDAFERMMSTQAEPGSPPGLPKRAAQLFMEAYDAYVSDGLSKAVPLTVALPPVAAMGILPLTAPLFSGWAPAFSVYWTPVALAGPGLIPLNPMDPSSVASGAAIISSQLPAFLAARPPTRRDAAGSLAAILGAATSQLRFIATTLVGSVTPTPLP